MTRSATAGEDLVGARLDQAAAQLFPEFSRARLQSWIRSGELRLDGTKGRPRDAIRGGEVLSLNAELESEVSWTAEALPLEIVYEDEELLVIDKPAGLVVHPGAGNHNGTLVNALLNHRPDLEAIPRGGIVHRLDKETSGLLVVAATLNAHRSLVAQLQKKDVQREYFAIVRGVPSGGGRVEAAIGRHPRQRTKMAVVAAGGKPAVTHYRIARRFAQYTALDVQLETGRTHQIRVHMAHRGYPLLGDPVYGGRLQLPRGASERLAAALRGFRRQALHAQRLSFVHPGSGDHCSFESPLSDDLEALLQVLAEENSVQGGQASGLS
ncbi:23S rRNA pseudouridine(1911/1915/1917) synthase RluD [Congregibacter litoralis]|uniref:23S rRNA pseudouridine(1911/1915/1917) synthase RluD n=1 Tax=Congregibacter litoralis TaxID=393662 RepID=UPI000A04C6DA|nr:23S rRNA pseudouridine(1911/1915/1917) synthase RluD [Congregibacter litoralis]